MFIKINDTNYYAYTANHDPSPEQDTIVFVHGASMDHSVWSHQSRYFAYHEYNVLALDLPGHNLSSGELLWKIEAMGGWVNQVINNSIGKGFHIVGHSMGALVALEAASTYDCPHAKMNSLTLVGFSYPMAVTPVLMDAAENDPSTAYSMMTQWSHDSRVGGEPVPGFWAPGMQMSMMENLDPKAVHAGMYACDHYQNGEKAFDQVKCPTLFICGVRDKMAPAKLAKKHVEKNDQAEIVMLPDCGHALMAESPDGVLGELKRFIDKHRSAP